MSRDKILNNLNSRHENENVTYLTCTSNGCWDTSCILRVRSKDNKVTAIEPDDTINKNTGREDAHLTDEEIKSGMVQHRPCVQGHSWTSELYAEDRVTKPLKRVGGRGPGKGHFVEKADSQCNYDSLDCEIRMTKKCAEWNKVSIHPESKILLSLLLADISIFSYQGTARHILKS